MERKGSPHTALVHLLQEGSIALPAVLFSEYKRLGLTEGQVMLLLHLMVFQEKEGKSFPTVSELEERMSVPADQIVSWLQSLVRGGFLKIEEETDWAGTSLGKVQSLPSFTAAGRFLSGQTCGLPIGGREGGGVPAAVSPL